MACELGRYNGCEGGRTTRGGRPGRPARVAFLVACALACASVAAVLLCGCTFGGTGADKPDVGTTASSQGSGKQGGSEGPKDSEGTMSQNATVANGTVASGVVTEFRFEYEDRTSGNLVKAEFEGLTPEGGVEMQITKRVGRANYPATVKKTKTYVLDARTYGELCRLLGSFDLKGYSQLPRSSSYAGSVSRSLRVVTDGEISYISDFLIFPDEVPSPKEVMYVAIFNFINDLTLDDPQMADVAMERQEDPYDRPFNQERTVMSYGKSVRLVPGTGYDVDDGEGARIDFGDRSWWVEEGYVGTWVMTDADRAKLYPDTDDPFMIGTVYESASLTIREDGSGTFVLDGDEHTIELCPERYYLMPASFTATPVDFAHGDWRGYSFGYLVPEGRATYSPRDFDVIRIWSESEPYPMLKPPVELRLSRVG